MMGYGGFVFACNGNIAHTNTRVISYLDGRKAISCSRLNAFAFIDIHNALAGRRRRRTSFFSSVLCH